ncbi:hypothetical protein [Campylobacter hyointestinalis]|uniref:Uncharacterized protein n=1 Tax=Campylobacter hyointestinalis subsp. lawsonii TaxID=91353 RepID=A0AAV6EF13_CAMHY|nr:hypothetical protein [Campylobacter hyointestinalis]KAB0611874.1 hypothetical protein F7P66_07995 [Campylobacter hyointestinalis subsp. lawsonii]RAZ49253.1 hypothetical protein CHL9004_07540 [Campylobacter hyointestinalis subsp. lawsonii]
MSIAQFTLCRKCNINLATKALSETKNLMDKNSVNGVVDFRALNQSLNSLDFVSEFAKEPNYKHY